MINNALGLAKTEISSKKNKNKTVDSEKGKLIMLVNDFNMGNMKEMSRRTEDFV